MDAIPPYLRPTFHPHAQAEAVVRVPGARFTVLTPHLLRLEYDPAGRFEDRPSQLAWYRHLPVPPFDVARDGASITLETDALELRYHITGAGFTAATLQITEKTLGGVWRYGDDDPLNLRGTLRTLDLVSGAAGLEPGLLSRSGWTLVDDSHSLVFDDQGWLQERAGAATHDLYFFAYGADYRRCLRDFMRLAGPVPLLPRWALGNWWSRYWEYSQKELAALMQQFRARDVPLSVCIVDMDWHITDTGNESSGWTGYTWNPEFFPEPESFLEKLHAQGLRVALNLHPAEGIHSHETAYPPFAGALGIDPTTEKPIPFAIADKRFARAYFDLLHHPLEDQGIDFWWLDWQQGTASGLPRLDPLWWLNHLHSFDRARDGVRRRFILSRWGGLGNHRYPVGFSGDTYVNWDSLAFQPYQTATAANVGFGWWSHDIGGHMQGIEEAELYTRWVQFGVFSPILRLHSTKNLFHERRPWGYDETTERVTRAALQLRHALIPYLYTMAWQYQQEGVAPIRPLYHDYPQHEPAYCADDQYTFGSELIAAPYVSPADADTRLSRQVLWLPPGDWFHFFDGGYHGGGDEGRWEARYGDLADIPVFARAGAIVPLGPRAGWGGVENPSSLEIIAFPGADGAFTLYEDDGVTTAYQDGAFALTRFAQTWTADRLTFTVEPATGETALLPARREYRLRFRGVREPASVIASVNGASHSLAVSYDDATHTAQLDPLTLAPDDRLEVVLRGEGLMRRVDERLAAAQRLVIAFRLQTAAKAALFAGMASLIDEPQRLARYAVDLTTSQRRALLETITGAGVHHTTSSGRERLILWNNRNDPWIRHRLSLVHGLRWSFAERFRADMGPVPVFRAILPGEAFAGARWELDVRYGDLLTLEMGESRK